MSDKKQTLPTDEDSVAEGRHIPAPPRQDMLTQLLDHESAFRVFLRSRIDDEAVAEDLLQQSLIRAVERRHSLRNEDSVVAWFYQILRHALIDYYRSRGAEARRNEAYLQELTAFGDDQEPPIDEVKATACVCLHRLLPNLRSNYAQLIRRIDLEGESPQRMAEELKISQNNLTVRLHRARQALRTGLEQACGICSKHGCLNCTCES